MLDYSGKAIAAISISGPCERITLERAIELGPVVWESTSASPNVGVIPHSLQAPTFQWNPGGFFISI